MRRRRSVDLPGVSGVARVDRRTKNLTKRLRRGEIAVIDHVDLDRVSAEALVACGAGAVVNVRPSVSGRYPNLGPEIIVEAGIPLVDSVGADLLTEIREGEFLRVDGNVVYRDTDSESVPVAEGQRQTPHTLAGLMEAAREGMSSQLEAFAANTMEYLRRERDLLLDGVGVPDINTDGVSQAGTRSPARRRGRPGHQHRPSRPARPHRRARLRLQGRPGHAAPLHP